jgi:monoterpene epsilon-lactone hydrolase
VTPLTVPPEKQNRVLINLHGGGFNADWGSEIESIPVANLTQTKVVAVLYSLAPEHPFPTALNESVAVYKELLKTYKPQNIGIYGTSAGAILTGEVASRLRQLGLPLPAALGIFSGSGDFSKVGDSRAMFALKGLSGPLSPPTDKPDTGYSGTTPLTDPVLSPIYADLKGFPPTLFLTSGRDLLLSNTVNLHRAYLHAGVNAQLVVFDGLPHAFWNDWNLPESQETYRMITDFFNQQLGK